jgi:hypothetical protein
MVGCEADYRARIRSSDAAGAEIGEVVEWLQPLLRSIKSSHNVLRVRTPEGLESAITEAFATYFADIGRWTADRWGSEGYVRKKGEEPSPPSQMLIKVIKELEFFAEFFEAPRGRRRIRGHRSISKYAVDALMKQGLLGEWLLSMALHADFDSNSGARADVVGLGGECDPQLIGDDLVYGFREPSAASLSREPKAVAKPPPSLDLASS